MASFDVIDAAMQGYRWLWAERRYLARLALAPVLVKFVCTITVLSLGVSENFVRQALIFLPDYFTEGWLLAHVVRLQFLGQRWPFRPTGDKAADEAVLRDRFRGVMAGTLVYVLSRYLFAGAMQLMQMIEAGVMPPTGAQEVTSAMAASLLAMMAMFVVFIWCFRLMWMFIPATLNVPVGACLRMMGRRFMPSIYMIGAWLVCFVPIMFMFQLVGSLLLALSGGMSPPLQFILVFGQGVVEAAGVIMSTVAIGWGIAQMMNPQAPSRRPGPRGGRRK